MDGFLNDQGMDRHPAFSGIRLHADSELAETLGAGIVDRQTIHEWPLSCVQRVVLEDGRKLIYKAQLPPTVEPAFYAHAVSSLMADHRFLAKVDDCEIMVLDWIDAPLLRDAVVGDGEWIVHGKELVAQIGAIDGRPPVYLDVGSAESWSAVVESTLGMLEGLIGAGRFRSIQRERVDALRRWAASRLVHDCVTERPRLIHGDLKAGQIFLCRDGYRVIDWQRPMIGPPEVDLVSLLVTAGVDPRAYVTREINGVFWFLFLRWAVVAQAELFPDFTRPIFGKWAVVAAQQIFDEDAPLPPKGIPPA
jgi:hypothetical protein